MLLLTAESWGQIHDSDNVMNHATCPRDSARPVPVILPNTGRREATSIEVLTACATYPPTA